MVVSQCARLGVVVAVLLAAACTDATQGAFSSPSVVKLDEQGPSSPSAVFSPLSEQALHSAFAPLMDILELRGFWKALPGSREARLKSAFVEWQCMRSDIEKQHGPDELTAYHLAGGVERFQRDLFSNSDFFNGKLKTFALAQRGGDRDIANSTLELEVLPVRFVDRLDAACGPSPLVSLLHSWCAGARSAGHLRGVAIG